MENIQQENIRELLEHIHPQKAAGEKQREGKAESPNQGWNGEFGKGRTWKGPSRSRTQPCVGFAGLGVVPFLQKSQILDLSIKSTESLCGMELSLCSKNLCDFGPFPKELCWGMQLQGRGCSGDAQGMAQGMAQAG